MSTTKKDRPRCPASVGPLRARQMPQSANWAYEVQTLVPSSTKPAGRRRRPGADRGEVRAGVRLAEELAPELLGAQDRREEPELLVVGPVLEERRACEVDPDPPDELGSTGAGELLLHDEVGGGPESAAAVRGRAR